MDNLFNQFQALVGTNRTELVNITTNNANGTSNATTLNGDPIVVRGTSVSPGNRAIIENGNVVEAGPTGSVTEVFV